MQELPELEEIVHQIVAAAAGVDASSIDSSTSMASLDLDSLSIVSIVAQCCARFEVEMATDDILELYAAKNVAEFVTALRLNVERYRACG